MNAKWYTIVWEIMESVPKHAWNAPEFQEMLTLLCDAQVEAAIENDAVANLMCELESQAVGADEPGRKPTE